MLNEWTQLHMQSSFSAPRWGIPGLCPPMWGGEGGFGPLAICPTTGPIIDLKTALDSFGLELSEYVAKFYLYVTDDVTVRVKDKSFDNLSSLSLPGKAAVSN